MKVIDVPVFNDDGSIQATMVINQQESQMLLQFALNYLTTAGLMMMTPANKSASAPQKLDA